MIFPGVNPAARPVRAELHVRRPQDHGCRHSSHAAPPPVPRHHALRSSPARSGPGGPVARPLPREPHAGMPRAPRRATRLRRLGALGRGAGDHLGAPGSVSRENPPIDHLVCPRRGNEGDQTLDELGRGEDKGRGPVAPHPLEPHHDAAVVATLETVLRERRPDDVSTQPLEAGAVARPRSEACWITAWASSDDEALDVLGVGHHAAEGEAVVGAAGVAAVGGRRTTGWSRSVGAPRSSTTQDTTPGRTHTPCRDVRRVRPYGAPWGRARRGSRSAAFIPGPSAAPTPSRPRAPLSTQACGPRPPNGATTRKYRRPVATPPRAPR